MYYRSNILSKISWSLFVLYIASIAVPNLWHHQAHLETDKQHSEAQISQCATSHKITNCEHHNHLNNENTDCSICDKIVNHQVFIFSSNIYFPVSFVYDIELEVLEKGVFTFNSITLRNKAPPFIVV